MRAVRGVSVVGLFLLAGCSTDSGFLTGGTAATGWAKCYVSDGHAAAGGGFVSAQGQVVAELESAGVVWHGEVPEAVLLAVAEKCPPTIPED